jgi:hypothetical protein
MEEARREVGPYIVLVDDNYHFMDESARYEHGRYDTCEQAVAECKIIVDRFFDDECKPSMTPQERCQSYVMFGEDPFIVGGDRECLFSAWDYARERCVALCSGSVVGDPGREGPGEDS